jgi:hypothetical protein
VLPSGAESYSRWLKDRESTLDAASSRALTDVLDDGRARVETYMVPHAYRHLSPGHALGADGGGG